MLEDRTPTELVYFMLVKKNFVMQVFGLSFSVTTPAYP